MERKTWAALHSTSGSDRAARMRFQQWMNSELRQMLEEQRHRDKLIRGEIDDLKGAVGDWSWLDELASLASPGTTGSATSSGSTELSLQALDAVAEDTLRLNALSKRSGVIPGDRTIPVPTRMKNSWLDRLHTSRGSRAARR